MSQHQPASPIILQQKLSKLKQQFSKNKQTYESTVNFNQTLKPSLKVININLQTKIKPQHDKLSNQRKAIYELLNYDKKLSLKENYINFYHQSINKNHQLMKRLSKLEKRHKELNEKGMNFNQQLRETNEIKNSMTQDKIRMENLLSQLEQQKLKKISIKSALQQQQKLASQEKPQLDHLQYEEHNISEFDSFDEQQVLSQLMNSSNCSEKTSKLSINQSDVSKNEQSLVRLTRYNKSKSFHYHPQTFTNAHEMFDGLQVNNKPKSKQILNSLEKQLNPLKLNEIISYLQNQIDHLKKSQLSKILKQKKLQQRKRQFLEDKENHVNNKLDKIKTHIKNFKSQRFPNISQ